MNLTKYDEKLARSIQDEINCIGITENAIFPKEKGKEKYRPRTLIDETLEYFDPTPNIYTLFVQFNEKFFWNVLTSVQVKWSSRMTSCAGTCTFHPKNKECIISLSTPLLKLRPRKDLIETLLHEMIHAYLFMTNNNRDRDGHGPVFKSHMKRINRESGTNITIYHSFHEEVKLYQQHWWRCNGPCQKRAPYFGTVRRAMNRAPGPNDFWFSDHQLTCGGQFIKIKEPQKPEQYKKNKISTKVPEKNNILNWIKKIDSSDENIKIKTMPKISNQPKIVDWKNTKNNSISNFQTDMKKLGNNTNNVHGWGTGGPDNSSDNNNSSTTRNKIIPNSSLKNTNSHLSFSGKLGGSNTGRSILLDKYDNVAATSDSSNKNCSFQTNLNQTNLLKKPIKNSRENRYLENVEVIVTCPNCNRTVEESKINQHLDICLENTEISEIIPDNSRKKRKIKDNCISDKIFKNANESNSKQIQCPLCEKMLKPDYFNEHLNSCIQNRSDEKAVCVSIHDSSPSSINLYDSPHVCLICDKVLEPNMSLNDHLEICVASVFNDSTIIDNDTNESMNDAKQILENFPCPVCMALIKESLMNDHLDICLKKMDD